MQGDAGVSIPYLSRQLTPQISAGQRRKTLIAVALHAVACLLTLANRLPETIAPTMPIAVTRPMSPQKSTGAVSFLITLLATPTRVRWMLPLIAHEIPIAVSTRKQASDIPDM